jgi:hypothetical protein
MRLNRISEATHPLISDSSSGRSAVATGVVITDYPQLRARAKRNGSGMLRAAQRPQVVSDMKAGKREWPL